MQESRHLAHFYRDEAAAMQVVAAFAEHALRRGGGALLIGSPARCARVRARLGELAVDVDACEAAGRFVATDGDALLASFITPDGPDEEKFRAAVEGLVGSLRRAADGQELFAWGEMVNTLCMRGEPESAKRLEAFWERLLAETPFQLLCSYDLAYQPTEGLDTELEAPWGVHEEILTDAVLAPLATPPARKRRAGRERERV